MSFAKWWVPAAELDDGESEIWSVLANHSVSAWRAVGGKLVATQSRLVFTPNRIDRALKGRVWAVPLDSIKAVDRKGPTGGLFNGGLRSRMRIVTNDGTEHLFVVNKLNDIISKTEAHLAQRLA